MPPKNADVFARLSLLLKARYPLIQLVSHEEERVDRALARLAAADGLAYHTWRATTGLVGAEGKALEDSRTTEGCLRLIQKTQGPALFVFFDLHPYLVKAGVVRLLRDLCGTMGRKGQAIVLVGHQADVPSELHKELVILDVPLPDRDEVAKLLGLLLKSQLIEIPADRLDRFIKGSLGLTENEIKRLYARILLGGGRFSELDLLELIEEKRQAIRRTNFLEFWDSAGTMGDVGGMDNLKRWLDERRVAFSPRAKQFGLPEPRGVFLLGVQGCGKSLMAKAVADLWQLPLLRLDVAAVFQGSGRQDQSLRETTRIAESLSPVVLWIDEIEKGFLSQADAGGGQAFGYFLTWMQEKQKPVFVVATANEVRVLPPELLRKGRFDEIFFVDLPNVHERLSILDIHVRRRGRNPEDFELTQAAEETERFSGAELEQLVVAALFSAFAADEPLGTPHLLDAAREMIPLAVTMDDHLKELREWARPRARRASMDRRRIDYFEEWDELA